ncbi:ferrous iron transporter B [Pseudomonas sp. LPB0260]|uniref:ferrous iron transporter B n=1 Tax=Pseudomonas sp. LPB0260 TaxID=2614442 RepID=UPI0015C1FA64|nr:ferrous iron transporter B [Pseudomonas sp. LPB0260]QLC72465.1 ferrous iron transporter B [Pseudomonas sp. LPB0260]QLC75241.1 ferrous iron transporter B [Pseudomonas sp. LPB0260]
MVSGATSLSLVRDELFTTMEEAESSLEQFIAERDNGSLLQQAVEGLQQVRGALNLIELTGAELLAQEVLDQATDIPAGAGSERDVQLSALSNALHVLRRYLESVDANRQEMPELLLPAINDLRQAGGQPGLPESFFFSVRLDQQRPHRDAPALDAAARAVEAKRLRHMYQVGLLGFIREQNPKASLKLMARAMNRLDGLYGGEPRGRLCWIAAAALEAQVDGRMLARKSRKQLFSRVDRELKSMLANEQHETSRSLLKELLYLVALGDSRGPTVTPVREVFGLTPLPFTDHLLEEEYRRLAGPGQAVMRSLSSAIREELTGLKDMLDLIERGTVQAESLSSLHALLGKLSKTLAMVGLSSAGNSLAAQLQTVAGWREEVVPPTAELNRLAEAVLYVEGMVASLESGERRDSRPAQAKPGHEAESFALHQLNEARIVVVDEARAGLALAKRAITAYLESSGDRMHLSNVPFSLQAVRGGLWFLGQERAAELVGACAEYIQRQMLDTPQMPSEQMLETLADALSSLEYYLEAGAVLRPETQPSVLDLAADSVRALGMKVAV